MAKKIPIRVNNKIVGTVDGKLFLKKVSGSIHFLRVPPAISFDKQSLKSAYDYGATDVNVTDRETGISYCASIVDIYSNGFVVERGFGTQIALPMDRWKKIEPNVQPELF